MATRALSYLKIHLLFILISSFLLFSCRKNKDCTGIVTVVTRDAAPGTPLIPVAGATVQLKFAQLNETSTTDAEGKATFVLKLPSGPDVFVTKGALTGQSHISLEPGETKEITVEIQ